MATEIHALAGAYVLHALDDIERTAFGRHLVACETCAVEVGELRETTARLADGAWSAPPPRMRDAVFAQVRRTRQASPSRGDHRETRPASRRWRRWTVAAVAAGLLAGGAGVATFAIQEQRVRERDSATAAARAQTARIEAVLAAPDARLRTEGVAPGGRVTLVVSDRQDSAVAVIAELPDPGPDKVYQMWTIRDTPINAGVLAEGEWSATRLISGVRDADAFALSVEPVGGSATPSVVKVTLRLT